MLSAHAIWVRCSGLVVPCAWMCVLALPASPVQASTATEVAAGTLEQSARQDETPLVEAAAPSLAIELPLMSLLSFRDAGQPMTPIPAAVASAPAIPLEPVKKQIAAELTAVTQPDSEYSGWDAAPGNRTHERLLPYASIRTAMASTPWGGETQAWEPRFKVDIDGSVAIGTGSATYADREYQEFELNELLTTRSGKEYGFSQQYAVDHSYTNRGRLTLGASQYFPALLWNGDLELEEEFAQYQDRNTSAYDYRQGAFALRFTPEWDGGATKAEAKYQYRVRDYDEFSARSYKRHEGLLKLAREFNPQFAGEAYAKLTDYNYSYGSTSDNSRMASGGELRWEPDQTWSARAAVDHEDKTYGNASYRDYTQLSVEAQVACTPDAGNRILLEGEWRDYARDNSPAYSYGQTSIGLGWQRALTERLEVELNLDERRKEYDSSSASDYDTHSWEGSFDFYPLSDLNFYGSYGRDDYDYVNLARAFERSKSQLGARYAIGRWDFCADWRRTQNEYRQEALRDYTRDEYDVEANWRFDCQRVRVYYGIGRLAQADPGSYNEYDEMRYGAQWDYQLDSQTELSLRYDFNERAYEQRDDLEDSRFEARLNFEL